ncbi:hypothetical protein JW887_07055 [Candidatus Dojkabacteria bacterium]|nr:hypothetical protein [Candidatus Dojkabacteria bacterium]
MMNPNVPIGEAPKNLEEAKPTVVQQLKAFEKQGYVFHGSRNPNILKLEPRPATDVDKANAFNNDTAVFAAPSPTASVIFACMSLDNVPKELRSGNWSVGSERGKGIVARIPQKWQQYVSTNTGYVYVLDGSTFSGKCDTEGVWQVKSKQPVKPTTVLTVTFSDFEQLGGSVIWKEDD